MGSRAKKENFKKAQKQFNTRGAARRVVVRMPGCFMTPENGRAVFGQIINISNTGIGVITQTYLKPKTQLSWITLEKVIPFEVVWCLERIPDGPEDQFKYQCGLMILDSHTFLEDLFGKIAMQI